MRAAAAQLTATLGFRALVAWGEWAARRRLGKAAARRAHTHHSQLWAALVLSTWYARHPFLAMGWYGLGP